MDASLDPNGRLASAQERANAALAILGTAHIGAANPDILADTIYRAKSEMGAASECLAIFLQEIPEPGAAQ
jgi:hypothetical protein